MEFLAVIVAAASLFVVGRIVVNKSRQKDERPQRASWKRFAYECGLRFSSGNLLNGNVRVSGRYRGYEVKLFTSRHQRQGNNEKAEDYTCTNAILSINHHNIGERNLPPFERIDNQKCTEQQLAKLLFPNGLICRSRKDFQISIDAEKIRYRHEGFEVNKRFLIQLTNMLCDLADNCQKIVGLGGEVVPVLQTIVDNETHPFHSIALHLLQAISVQSQDLKHTRPNSLCPRCLVRYESQKIRLPLRLDTTYFACPKCHQSRGYFAGQVVVVLDNRMEEEQIEIEDTLRVNWFVYRKVFDFDAIEIEQATDEDVERFAVQIGNDTSKSRSSRYRKMSCRISPMCELSENTIRILEHMVGNVEISDRKTIPVV